MSSRSSLRRSRRAPKRGTSDYTTGDLVEIIRGEETLRGHLAQLLTEGSSPNPRWLVKFEGPAKDEELYEHAFGKVIEFAADDSGSDSKKPRKLEPEPAMTPSSGPEEESGNESGRVSAREERSRRRQALMVEEDVPDKRKGPPPAIEHTATTAVVAKKILKRPRTDAEPVTKVKMLTGTLYLYRGTRRRAEFVRRL